MEHESGLKMIECSLGVLNWNMLRRRCLNQPALISLNMNDDDDGELRCIRIGNSDIRNATPFAKIALPMEC